MFLAYMSLVGPWVLFISASPGYHLRHLLNQNIFPQGFGHSHIPGSGLGIFWEAFIFNVSLTWSLCWVTLVLLLVWLKLWCGISLFSRLSSDPRYRGERPELPCGATEGLEILLLMCFICDLVIKVRARNWEGKFSPIQHLEMMFE